MPDPIEFLLIPLLIAAGVSLAVLIAAGLTWKWTARHWGGPIALGAGVLSVYVLITGAWPGFPATDSKGWIVHVTIAAVLLALLMGRFGRSKRVWWTIVLLIAIGGPLLILRGRLTDPERMTFAWVCLATMTATTVVWCLALEPRDTEQPGSFVPVAMLLLALFCAIRLLMTNSTTYGRMGLVLAGAVAPMVLFSLLNHGFRTAGAGLVFVAYLTNILHAGTFDANLDFVDLAMICIAPVLMASAKIILKQPKSDWRFHLISLILLILPLATVVGSRFPAFFQAFQVDAGDYAH